MFDRWYATFASNSKAYLKNRNNNFRCTSPVPLIFRGAYLTALHSISYPRSFNSITNVDEAYVDIQFNNDNKPMHELTPYARLYFNNGKFKNAQSVIEYLNKEVKDAVDTFEDTSKDLIASLDKDSTQRVKRQEIFVHGDEDIQFGNDADEIKHLKAELERVKLLVKKEQRDHAKWKGLAEEHEKNYKSTEENRVIAVNSLIAQNNEATNANAARNAAQADVIKLTKEVETAKLELAAAKTLGETEKDKRVEAEKKLTKAEKDLNTANDKLNTANSNITKLNNTIKELERKKKEADDKIKQLDSQKLSITKDKDKAEQGIRNANAELLKVQTELEKLKKSIDLSNLWYHHGDEEITVPEPTDAVPIHHEAKRDVTFHPSKPLLTLKEYDDYFHDTRLIHIKHPFKVKNGLIQYPEYKFVRQRNDILILKNILDNLKKANIQFSGDNYISVEFDSSVIKTIQISPELGEISGFGVGRLISGQTAIYTPDILAGIHGFILYETNGLVHDTIFMDKMAPVLRYVTIAGKDGEVHEENYTNPTWVPILATHMEELHFEIRTIFDKPMPFEWGIVLITLMFKRAIGV